MIQMLAQATKTFGGGLRPNSDFFGGEQITTTDVAVSNVELFVSQILGFLTLLAGLLFIFYFVLGAFRWISAGGDSGNTQKARDQMTQAVIGMILIVASYSIIGLVGNLFGFDILNPATEINKLIPTSSSSVINPPRGGTASNNNTQGGSQTDPLVQNCITEGSLSVEQCESLYNQ